MKTIMAKATIRKRPKRIQKKIDKRGGYLRYRDFHQSQYTGKLLIHTWTMSKNSKAIVYGHMELGKEMLSVVEEATQKMNKERGMLNG